MVLVPEPTVYYGVPEPTVYYGVPEPILRCRVVVLSSGVYTCKRTKIRRFRE